MPETPDARRLLELAEHAANAGDLASADELLRNAARLQESELGPPHSELANTLNNLAIVAEKSGRMGDAETFYRRAVAIAAATLPADHPMVVASRQNLEDFCHASGLPVDHDIVLMPTAHDTELGLDAFASEGAEAAAAASVPAEGRPLDVRPPVDDARAIDDVRPVDPDVIGPRASASSRVRTPPSVRRDRSPLVWVVLGVVAFAIAGLVMTRQPLPDASTPPSPATQTSPTPAPPAAESAAPGPGAASPTATPSAPAAPAAAPTATETPTTRADTREPSSAPTSAPVVTSNGIGLAAVELCRSFSTTGGAWRCDPAGDSVAPGPLVLYTRVKSPRDTAVVHRWYRGDAQELSAKLSIRANPTEGYRTYSRRTVGSGEAWRVEVRSPNGDLLHERRFVVR